MKTAAELGDTDKRGEKMIEFDHLQHIPLEGYAMAGDDYYDYEDAKDSRMRYFGERLHSTGTPINAVCKAFNDFDYDIQPNGMEKFVLMVVGMIFQMKHDDIDPVLAETVAIDIGDFDTGNYDGLFPEEDLKLIKADIEEIRSYLKTHPELLTGLSEYRGLKRIRGLNAVK